MIIKRGFLVRYVGSDYDPPVSLGLPTPEECAWVLGLVVCSDKACKERINPFGMHAHIPEGKFLQPQLYSKKDVERAGHQFRTYEIPCGVSITWHFWSKTDSPPIVYFQEQKIVSPDEVKG